MAIAETIGFLKLTFDAVSVTYDLTKFTMIF